MILLFSCSTRLIMENKYMKRTLWISSKIVAWTPLGSDYSKTHLMSKIRAAVLPHWTTRADRTTSSPGLSTTGVNLSSANQAAVEASLCPDCWPHLPLTLFGRRCSGSGERSSGVVTRQSGRDLLLPDSFSISSEHRVSFESFICSWSGKERESHSDRTSSQTKPCLCSDQTPVLSVGGFGFTWMFSRWCNSEI